MLCISTNDEIANRVRVHHDLADNNTSSLILAREEYLRHDKAHSETELHTDLVLLVSRE